MRLPSLHSSIQTGLSRTLQAGGPGSGAPGLG
jgi:hypothetical protein